MNTDGWLQIHGGGLFFSIWAEAQTSEFPCCCPLLVSRFSWHFLSLRVIVHSPVTILQRDRTADPWTSGCVCVCVFMMRLQLIVSPLDPSRDSTSHGQCGTVIFIIENHLRVSEPTQSKLMLFMGQLSLTSVWTLAYKAPGFTSHVRFTSQYIQAVETQITRNSFISRCALTTTPTIS